jgi:hypothetical protein
MNLTFSYARLALIIGEFLLIIGLFMYINSLKSDLKDARYNLEMSEFNISILKKSLELEKNALSEKIIEAKKIVNINDRLISMNSSLEKEVSDLNNRLNVKANGQQRDIGEIAIAKTKLMEKIINNASNKVLRCFELSSGSEIKDGETNSECQELFHSNSK